MAATDDTLHPDQDYQRFLAQGRFMIQRSRSSARDLVARPAFLPGGAEAITHRYIASMPDLTVTAVASDK